MRVLIVEDETAAADSLTYLLRRIDPSIEIAGYAESVEQTIDILATRPQIDLIFMDIHLSDGSAFSIFDKMAVETPVVFTTAYDQYALNAFKVNSIDYLLKPIRLDDLKRAIDKFRRLTPVELLPYLASLPSLSAGRHYPGRLMIPLRDKIIPVAVSDICYIYSTNRQTEVALNDSRKFIVSKSLEQLMTSLDPSLFRRVNKQFIISKESVKEIVAWFDSRLLLRMTIDTPEEVFVSKNSAADFKKWIAD